MICHCVHIDTTANDGCCLAHCQSQLMFEKKRGVDPDFGQTLHACPRLVTSNHSSEPT
jgi:hypothetical protein